MFVMSKLKIFLFADNRIVILTFPSVVSGMCAHKMVKENDSSHGVYKISPSSPRV